MSEELEEIVETGVEIAISDGTIELVGKIAETETLEELTTEDGDGEGVEDAISEDNAIDDEATEDESAEDDVGVDDTAGADEAEEDEDTIAKDDATSEEVLLDERTLLLLTWSPLQVPKADWHPLPQYAFVLPHWAC